MRMTLCVFVIVRTRNIVNVVAGDVPPGQNLEGLCAHHDGELGVAEDRGAPLLRARDCRRRSNSSARFGSPVRPS